MSAEADPDGFEATTLLALADFAGRRVLEVGSGDGRLTWRYADLTVRVTAIEPYQLAHQRAVAQRPDDLADRVTLQNITLDDLAASTPPSSFDIAVLSWSL